MMFEHTNHRPVEALGNNINIYSNKESQSWHGSCERHLSTATTPYCQKGDSNIPLPYYKKMPTAPCIDFVLFIDFAIYHDLPMANTSYY